MGKQWNVSEDAKEEQGGEGGEQEGKCKMFDFDKESFFFSSEELMEAAEDAERGGEGSPQEDEDTDEEDGIEDSWDSEPSERAKGVEEVGADSEGDIGAGEHNISAVGEKPGLSTSDGLMEGIEPGEEAHDGGDETSLSIKDQPTKEDDETPPGLHIAELDAQVLLYRPDVPLPTSVCTELNMFENR